MAYGLAAIGLAVTVVIKSGLLGAGFPETNPLWTGESIVTLVALAAPAVICGLLPPGTGVRAGSIIGWLAAIGVFLISQSIVAIHPEMTAPTITAWVIALSLGIALLAGDRRRRALSTR